MGIRNVIYEIVVISHRPTSGYFLCFSVCGVGFFSAYFGLRDKITRGKEGGGASSYHVIVVEKMFTHFGSDISETKV